MQHLFHSKTLFNICITAVYKDGSGRIQNTFYYKSCVFVSNVASQSPFDEELLHDIAYCYRRLNDAEINMFPGNRYK